MNSVLERTTATVSPSLETKVKGSGAGDAIAPLGLGCVKRAVGAREKCIGGLTGCERRDACGNGYPHAGRERAPIEIGDDRAQPVKNARGDVIWRVGKHQQEFLAAVTAEPVGVADVRKHGDGECPEHLVTGGMAVGVV